MNNRYICIKNMFNLSTDNLYKSITVLGLITLIYSISYPVVKSSELEIERQGITNRIEIESLEDSFLLEDLSSFRQHQETILKKYGITDIDSALNELSVRDTALFVFDKLLFDKNYREFLEFAEKYPKRVYGFDLEEICSSTEEFEKKCREREFRQLRIKNDSLMISLKSLQIKRWKNIAFGTAGFGISLFLIGLSLWIANIQIFSDKKTKIEYELLKIQLEEKTTKTSSSKLLKNPDNDKASPDITDPRHQ